MKKTKPRHIRRHRSVKPRVRRFPGFALAEILLAVTIIGVIQGVLFTSFRGQLAKGNDAKRKNDLAHIKTAFEEYYNDNNCYPPATILATCGGAGLSPYLAKIPCDPTTKQPYQYVSETDICAGYRVLAGLENKTDSDSIRLGCNGPQACGYGAGYNYGISAGTQVLAPGITPPATPTQPPSAATPTPTPTPTPKPTQYACSPQGVCNVYADPVGAGCPVTYPDPLCSNQCGNPANLCTR